MTVLYFLLHSFIAQSLNLTVELVMPIGIPNKKSKAETRAHSAE